MVSNLNLDILLDRNVDLMTNSSCAGENQVDTSLPMHTYRSRCFAMPI
jgi:hypothetical protein